MSHVTQEPSAEDLLRAEIEADRRVAGLDDMGVPTAAAAERAPVVIDDGISAIVPLRWPVGEGVNRIERLSIRPPTFFDVEAVTKGEIAEIELHARMCGVSADVLRALRWSDFEVMSVVARHLAPELRKR